MALIVNIYAQSISIAKQTGDGPWVPIRDVEVLSFAAEADFFSMERDHRDPSVWAKWFGRYGTEPTLTAEIDDAAWVDTPAGQFLRRGSSGQLLDAAAVARLIRHDQPGVRRIVRTDWPERPNPKVPTRRSVRQLRLADSW